MISPVNSDRGVECLYLCERILPVGAVDDQNDLMGCAGHRFVLRALDPFQFFHQVLLRRQASGGVGNQYVDPARLRGGHCIEHDRCRITAALRDHFDVISRTPDRELFACRGAKGVARRQ